MARSAYLALCTSHGRRFIELERRVALEELFDRNAQLEAREVRSDAAVVAQAERQAPTTAPHRYRVSGLVQRPLCSGRNYAQMVIASEASPLRGAVGAGTTYA